MNFNRLNRIGVDDVPMIVGVYILVARTILRRGNLPRGTNLPGLDLCFTICELGETIREIM